jgi:hypothetical protein
VFFYFLSSWSYLSFHNIVVSIKTWIFRVQWQYKKSELKFNFNEEKIYLSAIVPCNFENIHDYNTKQAVSIPPVRTRTTLYNNYFLPSTVRLWNSEPTRNINWFDIPISRIVEFMTIKKIMRISFRDPLMTTTDGRIYYIF